MDNFYTNFYQKNNKIYLTGYGNGKKYYDEVDYKPYLFIQNTDGDYKTLQGLSVKKKEFNNIRETQDFLKKYEGTNFPVYGLNKFGYAFINDEFPGQINYNFNLLSIVSLDIEVASKDGMPNIQKADQEVTAITLTKKDQILTFGTKVYNGKYKNSYVLCSDEKDLLYKFLGNWNSEEWSPDVVTGWNIEKFDIPYLIHRIERICGEKYTKSLSPWGFVHERDITRGKSTANGDEEARRDTVYEIAGVTQLDYMQLYKRFNPVTQESYSLNNIASVELKEKKIDWKGEGYASLDDLYERNFDLYIDYNVHDALLVQRLEERLGFILLIISIAYKAKINYIDGFTTVKPWDIIIHNYLLDRKIVIPQTNKSKIIRELVGAYCKDPQTGLHEWIVSFDYEGEYPSILSQLNISPETYVEKVDVPAIEDVLRSESFGEVTEIAKRKNCCVAANGTLFSKQVRGFIPELVDVYKADRAIVKKKMIGLKKIKDKTQDIKNEIIKLDNFQQAIKILTNGLYGALSNKFFRWFDIDLAEAVTMTGQLATRYMEQCENKYLNKVLGTKGVDYVVAADTDSTYINLEHLVSQCGLEGEPTGKVVEFLDQVCKQKLKPLLEKHNLVLGEWFNSYTPVLKMSQDIITNKAIWTAKKRYILNVWDKEGVRYPEAELTYKGIEVVRSSTPLICRTKLKECLKIIMNKDDKTLQEFVGKFGEEFKKLKPEDIGKASSVNGIEVYANKIKGTPIHVRGALVYNELLKDSNLSKHLPPIRDHDKIKFVYLKIPNPTREHVISFHETIPEEWDLEKYIDYDEQWNKVFADPLKVITDVIKWDLSGNESLTSFFI